MNQFVPDFQMDENYAIPSSSGLNRSQKSSMAEEEVMELLWQNGQVVMQNQNHRSFKKSPPLKHLAAADQTAPRDIRPLHQNQLQQPPVTDHLFLQEDEMASWLHYPLNDANFDNDFCADFLYSPAPCVTSIAITTTAPPGREIQQPLELRHLPVTCTPSAVASSSRPPIPPARRIELDSSKIQNFAHISRFKPRIEPSEPPSTTRTALRESTEVDSCDTPAVIPESRRFQTIPSNIDCSYGGKHNTTCATVGATAATNTHSAGVSIGADTSSRENLATCEVTMTSSPGRSSGSAEPPAHKAAAQNRKRKGRESAGDAECHAKMMSMGCGMVPMMFPGVQQFMPPMGMGMGMGMGMNRPMMPFPNVLTGSSLPTPAASAHLGQRFPMPAFHIPPQPVLDQSTIQPNQSGTMLSSLGMQPPNHSQIPNFADTYQQYLSLHQGQLPIQQSQPICQPSSSKPGTSKDVVNMENHPPRS